MAKDLELRLIITADGKASVRALDDTSGAVDELGEAAGRADERLQGIVRRLFAVNESIQLVRDITDAVQPVLELAQSYQQLQARLQLAVKDLGDVDQASQDVYETAQLTGQALDVVGQLYVKTAGAAKNLGLAQSNVATLTRAVSEGFRVAGKSGATAAGAILQLTQSLTGATFRAEEFNSVQEAAPYLIDQVAKGLRVERADLKALIDQGKISSRDLAQALIRQSAEIEQAYSNLPQTVGQATQRVTNALSQYLGSADSSLGVSQALAEAISSLSEHMETVGAVAGGVAAGGLVKLTQAGAGALRQLVQDLQSRREQIAAMREQEAAAQTLAATEAREAAATATAQLAAVNARRASAAAALQAAQTSEAAAAATVAETTATREFAAQHAIYGQQRAALERELTAVTAQHAAAKRGLAAAEAEAAAASSAYAGAAQRASAAQLAADAAAASTATRLGVIGRALGLLGGPTGVLLGTVAGFAALAFAQRETTKSSKELNGELETQAQRLGDLGRAQLTALIAKHGEYKQALIDEQSIILQRLATLDEEANRATLLTAAQDVLFGRSQRMAEIDRERTELAGELEGKNQQLQKSEQQLSDVRQQLTEITAGANDADERRGQSIAAIVEALDAQREAQEAVTKAAAGYLAAEETRLKTIEEIAKAAGDEASALEASVNAARIAAVAARVEAGAREQALDGLQRELEARRESGDATEKELKSLQQKIEVQRAAVAQGAALAEASEQQAEQARLAASTYGDQSQQVEALANQARAARDAIDLLTQTQEAGIRAGRELDAANASLKDAQSELAAAFERGVENLAPYLLAVAAAKDRVKELEGSVAAGARAQDAMAGATQRAARAQALYADATRDAVAASKLQLRVADDALSRAQRQVQVRQAQIETDLQAAQASGDLAAQHQVEIDQADAAARQADLEVAARRKQVTAAEDHANALRLLAEADGEVTAAEAEQIRQGQELIDQRRDEVKIAKAQAEQAGLTQQALADQGEQVESLAESHRSAGSVIATAIDFVRSKLAQLSAASVEEFERLRAANTRGEGTIRDYIELLGAIMEQVQRRYAIEARGADSVVEHLRGLSSATAEQIQASERTIASFQLLDDVQLSGAREEVRRLKQELQGVQEAADDAAREIEDRFLRAFGSAREQSDAAYQRELANLQALREQVRGVGDFARTAELDKAIQQLERLHQQELDNIASEASAREQSAQNFDAAEKIRIQQRKQAESGSGFGGGSDQSLRAGQQAGGSVPGPSTAVIDEASLSRVTQSIGSALLSAVQRLPVPRIQIDGRDVAQAVRPELQRLDALAR